MDEMWQLVECIVTPGRSGLVERRRMWKLRTSKTVEVERWNHQGSPQKIVQFSTWPRRRRTFPSILSPRAGDGSAFYIIVSSSVEETNLSPIQGTPVVR